MLGRTLGHYRVEARLGEGGMGVVYRATDTRLGRPVAIKVLHPDRMADPERRRRFIQEARAASALNHPNIITIHDIDTQDGIDFIAMEYVEGHTLDQLISRRLRLAETLKYTVQITDALAKAHTAGIVHRDLKPANIMVSTDGIVKILDFGLAKLTEPVDTDPAAETQTALAHTEEGALLGTVTYMSPEQAEGRKIDARSDIFSFGSVLYEMTTGRPAFQGGSKLSTLSAILHQEPKPLGEVGSPELKRIIGRCLRKDPDRRFQHMADIRVALLDVKEESESGRLAHPVRQRPRRFPVAVLVVALVAAALLAWSLLRPRPATELLLTRLTYDSGLTTDPALSPDGKLVAYASDRAGEGGLDIWVQQLATGQTIRLTRHPADDREPSFSPDSSRVVFRSERDGGGVWLVSALGGEEKLIAPQGRRPRFSPDGARIACWVGNIGGSPTVPGTSKIYITPAAGGTPVQVRPEFAAARYPVWSPDGRLLFWGIRGSQEEDWWITSDVNAAPTPTGLTPALTRRGLEPPPGFYRLTPAEWLEKDRILFAARHGDAVSLWQVPLSGKEPARLTTGSTLEMQPAAIARGLYAFASLRNNHDIWKLPLDHRLARPTGAPERLTTSDAPDVGPMVAADGSRVLFGSRRSGFPEIWVKDLASGREAPVASNTEMESWPAISPDGSRMAYRAQEGQKLVIFVLSAGQAVPEKVCEDCTGPWSFSPDSRQLLYWPLERSVALLDLATRQKTTVLERPGYAIFRTRFSPDGRWITFHARHQAGRSAIYVTPFRGLSRIPEDDWIALTANSYDLSPAWSPDGATIYFLSERDGFRCIWAQRVNPATKQPSGDPFPVGHFHAATRSMVPSTTNWLSLSAAPGMLVFNLVDVSGNLWLARAASDAR
jgi:serine/threonine protein kinase